MRMRELAVIAERSLRRLSQVVAWLEKRGWVRRSPDPTYGRYTLAILTEEGWQKVVQTAPRPVEALLTLVIDHLTKAQKLQLTGIGHRVLPAIDPDDTCISKR